jgi:hypothetical protein
MKHRIRKTCLVLWLFLLAFAATGFTGQGQVPKDSEEARDLKAFSDRVQAYVQLQKQLAATLPALKPTNNSAQIFEYQQTLARLIVDARSDAQQGDIFTHEAAERFRKIVHDAFKGPEGRLARRTIRQDDPAKVVARLQVNEVFPEGIPLTTTPPTLLSKLPELPQELVYRIVGRDLTLVDIKARLIVDLIPNAIP